MRSSSAVLRVTAALALMLAMLTGVFGFTAAGLNQAAAQTGDEEIVLTVPESVAPGAAFSVDGAIVNNSFGLLPDDITAGLYVDADCTVASLDGTVTASAVADDYTFTLTGTAPVAPGAYYLSASTTLTNLLTEGTPEAVVPLSTCVLLTVAAPEPSPSPVPSPSPSPSPAYGAVLLELATCTEAGMVASATGEFIAVYGDEIMAPQLCRAGNESALTFSVYDAATDEVVAGPVTVGAGLGGSDAPLTPEVFIPFFTTMTSGEFYLYEETYDATSETFFYDGEGAPVAVGYFLETIVTGPVVPSPSPSEEPSASPSASEEPSASPSASEEPSASPSPVPGGTIAPDLVTAVGIICEDTDLAGQYLYLIDVVAAEQMDVNCRLAGEGEHTFFTARSSDASTIDEASTDATGLATLDGLYDENFFLYEDGDFNVPYGSDNIFVPSEGDGVIITPAEVGQVNVVVIEFVEPGASASPSASPSASEEPTMEPSASASELPGTPVPPSEAPSAAPSGAVTELPDTGAGASSSNAGLTFGLIGLVVAAGAAALVLGLRKRTV